MGDQAKKLDQGPKEEKRSTKSEVKELLVGK